MSMKPLSLTLPERERALLLCLFALFLIALCQVLLSLVSGEVSVISESFLPWRMVAYSLLAYPSATFHSKKRERAIAFTSLIRRGSSKAPLRVEISPPAECKYRAGSSFQWFSSPSCGDKRTRRLKASARPFFLWLISSSKTERIGEGYQVE